MDNTSFSFDLVDKYTPEQVIRNEIRQIEEATKHYVIGEMSEYNGEIYSYTKEVGLGVALRAIQASNTIDVDIQDELGELTDERHRYEVYLKAKNMDNYKYRLMFVDYGAVAYPVTIILNEELAVEYSGRMKDSFLIGSMKELHNLLDKVINSKTLLNIIQNLINESLRRERAKGQ